MKMTLGNGTISNYSSYSNNCTKNQYPYKIPVNNLQDVQLYIQIGGVKPEAAQYQLIHTCGALGGTVEALSTPDYVIGQSSDNYWYGVFKNFSNPSNIPTCFVIAITLTITGVDYIYFSDEYCVETCLDLIEIKGCYGNLDSAISFDRQGIYFGVHAGEGSSLGDETVKYEHKLLLRHAEVSLSAIKKTFKQGRTRNFRTETEDIYEFLAEFVPEWYIREIGSVFDRGEIYFDGTKYLVEGVGFEKIEPCKRIWKPVAQLKESYYQSFSCETDPCAAASPTCCNPSSVTATVDEEDSESPGSECCNPEIINAEIVSDSEYAAISFEFIAPPVADTANVISFQVPDETYQAGILYLFLAGLTGSAGYGTVAGTTLTWNLVAQIGDASRRLQIYSCVPGSTVTMEDVTYSGFTSTGYFSAVVGVHGVPNTELAAIIQAVTASATSTNPSITMAALDDSNKNAVLAIFANSLNPFGGTPEAGWTEEYDIGFATPNTGLYVMTQLEATDNTPTVTAASSDWIGVAIELKAAEVLP